ncbi:MBL fold metallo-hydrolase [Methanoculleus sp. FWC-SCC1]|uniref:MBL fold metallo-hydrolase n=1 Tax=Methanoculleus frigidifontis TaxID=2584085 RepID=A0ABT8MCF1_9EURY|nr:MBL fold metallo-hydrolase [Methanoculleus sp. FWC-SCC1]MDN7025611.1 MBL fold metallo-hydrolase [Methanoculleus sp. FWC-SCC1]
MELTILASGSKGNCAYLSGENGALLIDAGLSARELLRRLARAGGDERRIEAILLTHEHSDHLRGADVLARRLGIPLIATEGTLAAFFNKYGDRGRVTARRCRSGDAFSFGDFTIEPFATSHDAREPCGFCIGEGDLKVGCCTDTGIVTPAMLERLSSCDAVLLESNHCPDMLENGPYPFYLKQRIRSSRGHLSNAAAACCLQTLAERVHGVLLAHLSEVNNTPEKALSSAQERLGHCIDATEITVAPQNPAEKMSASCGIRL